MDAGDSWRLALLIVCLGLSGFFSASETAFIALPRARLLHLVRSGRPGADRVSSIVQRPIRLFELALSPVVTMLQIFSTMANRVLGISSVTPQMGEEEIRTMIAAGAQTGTVEAGEAALLEKVFRFGDRQMREIMTPRPEIIWIEQGYSLDEFLDVYSENTHTRFPVFDGSMENVRGVLSVKDVLAGMKELQSDANVSVTTYLRPALFVPETKSVSETFNVMRDGGHSVVLTVDEFGGIAGLATLKQMMAVIVGQMGDEGAAPEDAVTALGRDAFRMDAGLAISDINEELDLDIPDGDYQTLAGFILDRLGSIPEVGDVMEFDNFRITIKAMERVKIEEVELRHLNPKIDSESGSGSDDSRTGGA